MEKHHPEISFERYADDIICHCDSYEQANLLKTSLADRLHACALQMHPDKTGIAYCADANRRLRFPIVRFDFLSYTFKPRQAVNRRGQLFTSFSPAVGDKVAKVMRRRIRHLALQRLSRYSLVQLSVRVNALLDGWVRYFGLFHRSLLQHALRSLNLHIVKWAQRKFKKLRGNRARAWKWLAQLQTRSPSLFKHWAVDMRPAGQ